MDRVTVSPAHERRVDDQAHSDAQPGIGALGRQERAVSAVVEHDVGPKHEARGGDRQRQHQQVRDIQRQVHEHREREVGHDRSRDVQQAAAQARALVRGKGLAPEGTLPAGPGTDRDRCLGRCGHATPSGRLGESQGIGTHVTDRISNTRKCPRPCAWPQAMGDLVDEEQAPAVRLVSPEGRAGPCEAGARVDHLHPQAPCREPELDARISLGSNFGVAHCGGHQLGDEQEDAPADGGGQSAVASQHRSACRRSGFPR
jgi:hypothetical protein